MILVKCEVCGRVYPTTYHVKSLPHRCICGHLFKNKKTHPSHHHDERPGQCRDCVYFISIFRGRVWGYCTKNSTWVHRNDSCTYHRRCKE